MKGKEKKPSVSKKIPSSSWQDKLKIIFNKIRKILNMKIGAYKAINILAGLICILLAFMVLSKVFNNITGSNDYPEYSLVYQNADGELRLLDKKDKEEGIKLSSSDSTTDVVYANTTDRYILFMKNSSLYLYDSKNKEETLKVLSDVKDYMFTPNDKYVVATDEDNNLYSYNFKDEKQKLDSDISSIKDVSDTHVIYVKEGALYIKGLKASKDDKVKIESDYDSSAKISEDGKKVLYINSDKELRFYTIKNGKSDKIANDVYEFYCDEECKKLYYVVSDGEFSICYYNGKEATKVVNDIYSVSDVSVEDKEVVYVLNEDGKYVLYYQKLDKEAVKIEDGLDSMVYAKIFKGKEIYYVNSDDEVRYVKIKGSKLGEVLTIAENVEDSLRLYKKGYVFVADVNKNSNGDLYFASNGKAKKVDEDVYFSYVKVSNNGKKVFYLKDYTSGSGDLYYTTGGKGKKIDTDVYRYQYISDKLVYYLKDYSISKKRGDLYRYNGNKGIKVVENVSTMASNPNYFKID